MLRVGEKPFAVHDGEPGPGDHGRDAEKHADPEVEARGARGGDVLEFGPVGDHEAEEDKHERLRDGAPREAAALALIAHVRHDGDEHGNDGHEHAGKRSARHADADGDQAVEDDVAEEGKPEGFDDVGLRESLEVLLHEEHEGQRHEAEGDESPEGDENGVVLR